MSAAGGVRMSVAPAAQRRQVRIRTSPAKGKGEGGGPLTTMKSLLAEAKKAQFSKKAMDDDFDSDQEDSPDTATNKRKMRESVRATRISMNGMKDPHSFLGRADSAVAAMNKINEALLQRDMSMMPDTQPRFGAQITRDMTKMVQAVTKSNLAELMKLVPIAAWFMGSFIAFTFLCKVVFGPPDREVVPDTWSATALSQVLCAALYIPCMLMAHPGETRWIISNVCSIKYWMVCFPYSCAYALQYYLWCEGFKYISTASGVAVFQSRMFLDMFIAYLIFSRRISLAKFLMVSAVFILIITHTLTIATDPMSKNPALGRLFFGLYAVNTALMNSWFPWWVPKMNLSSVLLSYVSSLMTAAICVVMFCTGPTGPFSKIADGYIESDVWVFVAWVSIDAAAFFCPIWVSPLFLTLCQACTMPMLYVVEMLWFQTTFVFAQFSTVVGVASAVICVALYQGEMGGRADDDDDDDDDDDEDDTTVDTPTPTEAWVEDKKKPTSAASLHPNSVAQSSQAKLCASQSRIVKDHRGCGATGGIGTMPSAIF